MTDISNMHVIGSLDGICPGMSRAEAFERFMTALAVADLSPSDRYRIHVAGCEYASAAAQEMLTEFDMALRRQREPADEQVRR